MQPVRGETPFVTSERLDLIKVFTRSNGDIESKSDVPRIVTVAVVPETSGTP